MICINPQVIKRLCYTIMEAGTKAGALLWCSLLKFLMKPYDYYQTTSVSIPTKDKYMTIYYYRKGVMVGMKRQFDVDFVPPKGCVEEKVLDEVSYNAHLKHYHAELKRLQDELCADLIQKYKITDHPKAIKIFNKAWDMGCSGGPQEVEYYFQDLVELILEAESTLKSESFFEITDKITGQKL